MRSAASKGCIVDEQFLGSDRKDFGSECWGVGFGVLQCLDLVGLGDCGFRKGLWFSV